ncbi:hypothetical protein TBLA_0B08670 [Henningerozyma blattae CBS 6284]|uniref:Uncharacterized protein n=1 Tax=Henningerozyma blattae (strain ATCC 34711 / CBS 6284 / DSM 70876 / NBRC 10599 / NRRL Y-10934 / UCD 77-7) TaxID=1071380 RepID=I2GZY0_HENB6|nr:hypothetical protein TBLA_0B08670 [Tetrapisispora blattae CBS 6284]CCH59682.1 hypothetical protein TBLA_0B08670 [Tetrapisispora blattae CBS 6284]
MVGESWNIEKEEEVAAKILKRAEMAKVARQLKIRLSKLDTSTRTSKTSFQLPSIELNNKPLSSPMKNAINEDALESGDARSALLNSPLKRKFGNDTSFDSSPIKVRILSSSPCKPQQYNSSPLKESSTPFTGRELSVQLLAPPSSATNLDTNITEHTISNEQVQCNIKKQIKTQHQEQLHQQSLQKLAKDCSPTYDTEPSQHVSIQSSQLHIPIPIPGTPPGNNRSAKHIDFQFETPKFQSKLGADLLMYLSASPYSALRPSQGIANNGNIESCNKETTEHPLDNKETSLDLAQLLKTPNFNVGDFVHSLFSPSPSMGL